MKEYLKQMTIEKYGKSYVKALEFTMASEGAFANHEKDSGQMTYAGVARRWNPNWKGWKLIDKYLEDYPELTVPYKKKPVTLRKLDAELNDDDDLNILVYGFYAKRYYERSGADRVPENLGVVLFDISVLQGYSRAVKTLQRMLNRNFGTSLVVDGKFGNNTKTAVESVVEEYSERLLVSEMLHEYVDNLVEASMVGNNKVFLRGWLNRIINLRNYLRLNWVS